MKVIHINSEKSWRGGEQQMANLILHLTSFGVENYVVCKQNSEMSQFCIKHSIPFLEVKFSGFKLLDSIKINKYCNENKIDIIHTHSSNAHTAAYYAKILGCRPSLVVSKRTDFRINSPWKFNSKKVSKVLCVSKKIADISREQIKNKSKVVTVYSGINPKRFLVDQESLKLKYKLSNKPLIGNCSALAPHKDYYTFLNVAKLLPNYNFIIMGNGPLENEIKEYAKKLNLSNITFTGFMSDVNKYLKSLDIFLITSTTEGLGTSILDAMNCEVPVIATKAGGIPEIVKHNETGLLAEIKDHDQLAKQCNSIINDDSTRHRIVSQAKQMIDESFTDIKTATKTFEIYKSILKTSN